MFKMYSKQNAETQIYYTQLVSLQLVRVGTRDLYQCTSLILKTKLYLLHVVFLPFLYFPCKKNLAWPILQSMIISKSQICLDPFNSHEWPRQNFSLQHQYNINQISDENKWKNNFYLGIISKSNTKFSELTL